MPKQTYQDNLKPECKELDAAIESGNLGKVKELITAQNIDTPLDTQIQNSPLIVATIQGQPEIVKFLIEQKCNINYCYSSKYTALYDAINFCKNNKFQLGETYEKIALILIKQGADIFLPCITEKIQELEPDAPLRLLIQNLRKLKDEKSQTPAIKNTIGNNYDQFGEKDESQKWYLQSANAGNPYAMYNYSISLIKEKKQLQEAANWLLKSYPMWKADKDKLDIITKLEQIELYRRDAKENKDTELAPKTILDMSFLLSNYYQQQDNKEKASQYFAIVRDHLPSYQNLLKERSSQTLTYEHQIEFNELRNNQDGLYATQLLGEAVRLGSEYAINLLAINLKSESILVKILSSYYLSTAPTLSAGLKKETEKVAAAHKDFLLGLKALHGLGRKCNASEAVKIFENIAKVGNYPALAYLHSAAGHCQIAMRTTDEDERSERISKAIKTYEVFKSHYHHADASSNEFSRMDLFNKLFNLFEIAKNDNDKFLLIRTILEFVQIEALSKTPYNSLLKSVISALSNFEFLKSNLEAWKLMVDKLNQCHMQTEHADVKSLLIEQMQQFVIQSEKISPKCQFYTKKSLADCYNRHEDTDSLKSAIQHYEGVKQLETQAEEKFDLQSYRDTYKRFAQAIKTTSAEEAITAFSKAAEYGDIEAGLAAAAIAEEDHNKIDMAIQYFEKAMHAAIAVNDIKNIIVTLKQILAFKDKLDLSTKANTRINTILNSTQDKLNDLSLIKAHMPALSEVFNAAQGILTEAMVETLFKSYSKLASEQALIENIAKSNSGNDTLKNLLIEFEKNAEANMSACELIKAALLKYLDDSIHSDEILSFKKLLYPIFYHLSDNNLIIQLQNELIAFAENKISSVLEKNRSGISVLANLYLCQTHGKNKALIVSERTNAFCKRIEMFKKILSEPNQFSDAALEVSITDLCTMIEVEKDPIIIERAQAALYLAYTTSPNLIYKSESLQDYLRRILVQHGYLNSTYEIFEKYKNPGFFDKTHMRRQLYLAAKILLLTLNKKAAEKRFNLKKPQIDLMVSEASNKLRTLAATNLKNVKVSSTKYQYARLASWYQEIIENAKVNIPQDPDAFLLQAALVDQELYNMANIREYVIAGMQNSLEVKDQWIQEKMDLSKLKVVSIPESKATTENITTHVIAIEPSAPPLTVDAEVHHDLQKPSNTIEVPQLSLYPALIPVVNQSESLHPVVSANSSYSKLYPALHDSKSAESESNVALYPALFASSTPALSTAENTVASQQSYYPKLAPINFLPPSTMENEQKIEEQPRAETLAVPAVTAGQQDFVKLMEPSLESLSTFFQPAATSKKAKPKVESKKAAVVLA